MAEIDKNARQDEGGNVQEKALPVQDDAGGKGEKEKGGASAGGPKHTGRLPKPENQDNVKGRASVFASPGAKAGGKGGAPAMAIFRDREKQAPSLPGVVGNFLYQVGYATEYWFVCIWRVLRNAFIAVSQVLGWLLGLLGTWLGSLAKGLWRDFRAPFRRYLRRRRQLARVRERLKQKGDGTTLVSAHLQTGMQFLAAVGSVLLPLAALGALAFTVHTLVNMQYALAVHINGEVLGYVTDQSVVDSAKGILRDRIQLAEGQEVSDWQLNPTYSISRATSYTTTAQLVDKILLAGSEDASDLVQATGLYINGQLYAVTENGDALKTFLDENLQQQAAGAPEDATVSYVLPIECAPDNEEVFFASSVQPYEDLVANLMGEAENEQIVVADGQETLADIAVEHNLTEEQILHRNPDLGEAPADYVPEAGKSIVVQRAVPFLQVQTVIRTGETEVIPFTEVEQENENRALGTRMILQEGADGLQEVWNDDVYIDGEHVERRRVDELTVVLQEPVDQIVDVGTYTYEGQNPSDGTEEYIFPVPTSTWSSRGIGGHRGQDINAPTGEPIFACAGGTVVTSGWHFSYGYHVVINHGNGMVTLYGHCSSLAVTEGQVVKQGDYIGAVGSTGNSSGPHLHLEFQLNGSLMNPLNYVTPPPGYRFGRP